MLGLIRGLYGVSARVEPARRIYYGREPAADVLIVAFFGHSMLGGLCQSAGVRSRSSRQRLHAQYADG